MSLLGPALLLLAALAPARACPLETHPSEEAVFRELVGELLERHEATRAALEEPGLDALVGEAHPRPGLERLLTEALADVEDPDKDAVLDWLQVTRRGFCGGHGRARRLAEAVGHPLQPQALWATLVLGAETELEPELEAPLLAALRATRHEAPTLYEDLVALVAVTEARSPESRTLRERIVSLRCGPAPESACRLQLAWRGLLLPSNGPDRSALGLPVTPPASLGDCDTLAARLGTCPEAQLAPWGRAWWPTEEPLRSPAPAEAELLDRACRADEAVRGVLARCARQEACAELQLCAAAVQGWWPTRAAAETTPTPQPPSE